MQQGDNGLSLHLHVGVEPTLTLEEAHALVSNFEDGIIERQTTVTNVHSHIELANVEILPSSRVSHGLSQRIEIAVQEAADEITDLHHPHDITVRQVEGRLFVSLDAFVDGTISVAEAHDLSTLFQDAVRSRIANVGEVLIHLEPTP